MTELPGISFESKILCEEVRQEMNNKLMFLGVYTGGIVINQLPAYIPLAIYIETRVEQAGNHKFWLRLSGPGDGHFTLELSAPTAQENQAALMITPRIDVLMESEGTLKIEVSADQEKWHSLIEKEVTQSENLWTLTPPIALPQPIEQSQSAARASAKRPSRSRRASRPRKPKK